MKPHDEIKPENIFLIFSQIGKWLLRLIKMTKIVNLSINKTFYLEFEEHVNMRNKRKPPLDKKFSGS